MLSLFGQRSLASSPHLQFLLTIRTHRHCLLQKPSHPSGRHTGVYRSGKDCPVLFRDQPLGGLCAGGTAPLLVKAPDRGGPYTLRLHSVTPMDLPSSVLCIWLSAPIPAFTFPAGRTTWISVFCPGFFSHQGTTSSHSSIYPIVLIRGPWLLSAPLPSPRSHQPPVVNIQNVPQTDFLPPSIELESAMLTPSCVAVCGQLLLQCLHGHQGGPNSHFGHLVGFLWYLN